MVANSGVGKTIWDQNQLASYAHLRLSIVPEVRLLSFVLVEDHS